MSRLLGRSGRRYLARHPWQVALSILGVAIGVVVVVAVDLANDSAQRAFELSMEALSGRATHEIVGGSTGLEESLYTQLRVEHGLEAVAPVVESTLAVAGDGRLLRVLGIDPFAEAPFRARLGGMFQAGAVPLASFLTEPRTGVLSAVTARRLGLAPGDSLDVRVGPRLVSIKLIGVLAAETRREQQALGDLLVVDVAVAQELFGLEGRLTRIDLIVAEGASLAALAASLPATVQIRTAASRTGAMASMTRAFRLNLTALSLLALVVGMFLIYNSMTFAVVQRRSWIGLLRALGVTRGQVVRLILGEAAVVGLVGTLLGIAMGILLAGVLLRLVTTTINDLYFQLAVTDLHIAPLAMAKAAALGIGATLLAAMVPALEAARASPRGALGRSELEESWRRGAPVAAVLGLLLAAAGVVVLLLSRTSLAASFAGIFALIVGLAIIAPALTVVLMTLLRPLAARVAGVLGAMAVRGVQSALSRTGVAIAALMIAVSVTVGVGIMIDSFRVTVTRWLAGSIVADVYVSPPDMTLGTAAAPLGQELVEALLAVPGARASANVRSVFLPRPDGGTTRLLAMGASDDSMPVFDMLQGDFPSIWPAFRDGQGVMISEPYAQRYGVATGDSIPLTTDRGPRSYPVLGIYYDYSSERGVVAMHRSAYLRSWDDEGISGLAFFLEEQTDMEAFMARLVARAGPDREIQIRSNRAIREEAMAIFDRTFSITAVLRLLVVVVAFVGVLSALMALQLERRREIGVLRANGMTPGQVRTLVLMQTGLMGLVAGLLSLPVGWLLAWVMVRIINLRAFGWTLLMTVDNSLLLQAVVVSLAAALVAGVYPAWRLAAASPALALREE